MEKNYSTIRFAFGLAFAGLIIAGLSSCGKKDENSPGVEFMPDMYRSPSVEYYNVNVVDGDTINEAMMPVKGSVARGFMPYVYANTPEGFESAQNNLHSPMAAGDREKWEKDGAELYGKFCIHCHGASGAGDGKVGGKLPGPPPAYSGIQGLTEGRIFHVITYGKGMMGAHASIVNQEERWKLVAYVQKLQGAKGTGTATDSTKTAAAGTPAAGVTATTTAKEGDKK
jgi:mono/diheme cytochrome c family protein